MVFAPESRTDFAEEWAVSSRERYMAICRGKAICLVRFLDFMSEYFTL